ncbi:hypothetical protein [Cellulosimicrobium sp. Marseille-Q4280]|uniref:hypothetical protein n=1 Tax=Cellulosimicrobium sp. Marseille-Q4280 TaxID=2937992 RepID=UPI00203C302E|nr:hypothetical protein [Cellulosimicrobium sp. Marseille-Q4280]
MTLDAADDAFDRVESGTSLECWTEPGTVVPETPATLTACDATPDDVLLPADTEAISYTRTPEGIVATAAPDHVFPSWAELEQWRPVLDGGPVREDQVRLDWFVVVRPECELEVLTVEPVCDDGVPSVDISVTPPAGATERNSTFYIEWQGPGGGYDVVHGDPGFGHPWTTRERWPGFVHHDDGTISPTHDPEWRLTDVDLVLYASVASNDNRYSRVYRAHVEDAPTADPCADDPGPHFSVETRERWLAGNPYVAVRVLNEDDTAADITVTTPFGGRTFQDVAPGASAYQSFAVRLSEFQGVPVAVSFATEVDGQVVTRERVVTAWVGG